MNGRNKYVIKTIPNIGNKSLKIKLTNHCIMTKIIIIIVMQVHLRLKMINVQPVSYTHLFILNLQICGQDVVTV